MAIDADHVFARCQQAANIFIVITVRRLNARGMDDNIRCRHNNFINAASGDNARRITTRDVTRIPSRF